MRVTVRSPDPRRARALQDLLAAGGVEAMAIVGPVAERTRLSEDIALVDGSSDTLAWAEAEASRLNRLTARPVAVVAASCGDDPPPDQANRFDGWVQIDAPAGVLERELVTIRRRTAARAELSLRLKSARALGQATQMRSPGGPIRALYIGEPSPFYLAQERALAVTGGVLEAAFSSFMGFDHLHETRFDAVTLNATKDPTTALALCGALRRNARLHHLPTAMIVKRGDTTTIASAVDRGASLFLFADEAPEPTIRWLFEKIRNGRRHARADAGLSVVGRCAGDPAGTISPRFFDHHLTRIVDAAHASARPLTLAALRLTPAPGARAPSLTDWSRSARQIADLATRLVRSNDLVALLDEELIMVALPDATLTEGQRSAERISGVAECTAFASGDGGAGPIVLQHSIVELAPGESGAGFKARAVDPFAISGVRA